MRSRAISSSSSDPSTGCTDVFIARTPFWVFSGPAADLRLSLSFSVIRGARNLPLCRVFRCGSKGQSVMEPFEKAKRGPPYCGAALPVSPLVRIGSVSGRVLPEVVVFSRRGCFRTFSPKRLKVRPLAAIMSACVPPRPRRVGGANWYGGRDYYLKEISKGGGPRANRGSNEQTTWMVRRKPKKTSYARKRKFVGL